MSVIPDIDEDCTCKGRCGICYDIAGPDPEIVCPDCPIHGKSDVAKQRQREILERITVPDNKDETVDINEKSIQDTIKTYSEESKNSGSGIL